MRTDAREAALKILYAGIIDPIDVGNSRKGILKQITEEEADYAERILDAVEEHKESIIRVIDKNIRNFREDRLYPVDRAILMIAVAEILYFDDVPPVVSASEATDMAQKYSTETSADFVNGVLAGVIANV